MFIPDKRTSAFGKAYLTTQCAEANGWLYNNGIVTDQAPPLAQRRTRFANVVSPESIAVLSAEAMHTGLGARRYLRTSGCLDEAKAWLREAGKIFF